MSLRASATSVALLVCGLASSARGDMITLDVEGGRLVGGLTFRFNGQTETNALAGTFSGSFAGGPSFDAYCIDLYHVVYVGTNHYDVVAGPIGGFSQSPPSGSGALGGDGSGIGWLYQSGEARLAHESGAQALIDGAGLQIALWKMAYDGSNATPTRPIDLTSGNFQFLDGADPSSNQHLVYASAASFLAGYDGTQAGAASFLRVTDHGPGGSLYQDLVGPPSAPSFSPLAVSIPEPPSAALCGIGIGVIFACVMRKRLRSTSAG